MAGAAIIPLKCWVFKRNRQHFVDHLKIDQQYDVFADIRGMGLIGAG